MTRKNFSGQGRVTPILPMSPEATGWRRAGRPDGPGRLQASLRGCNAEATRCNRAGDTAWAPRCSAGRTAGSAGPRRRNAQLRWAMRGQDPLKGQRVPGSAGLLGDRTPELQATGPALSVERELGEGEGVDARAVEPGAPVQVRAGGAS